MIDIKLQKLFAYITRKYPIYSDDLVNFSNILKFSRSNRHLLRGFLNVIDDVRAKFKRDNLLTDDEYQLLDEVLLELELAIAFETSLR